MRTKGYWTGQRKFDHGLKSQRLTVSININIGKVVVFLPYQAALSVVTLVPYLSFPIFDIFIPTRYRQPLQAEFFVLPTLYTLDSVEVFRPVQAISDWLVEAQKSWQSWRYIGETIFQHPSLDSLATYFILIASTS